MRLHNAPEGAVLIDRDGDVWVRMRSGAVFIRRESDGGVVRWDEGALTEGDALFGPFTAAIVEWQCADGCDLG